MKDCGDYCRNIRLYLDNELVGHAFEDFSAHLQTCAVCRQELAAEQQLTRLLKRSRPLYSASQALRTRVITTIAEATPGDRPRSKPSSLHIRSWGALAAMVLLMVAGSMLMPELLRRWRAASYVEAAVAAHRSLLDGSQTLEVQTSSPQALTAWFTGKVPFLFHLPNSVSPADQEQAFKLSGGRLVKYQNGYAALVAYHIKQQQVSLLVASSQSAAAAGGEEVPFGGIVFHYNQRGSFNVTVWSNRGLTYALVSSLPGNGRQSCLVCHQSMADGARFTAQR